MTMLRSANDLHGYTLHATDGDIGRVDEFYFDDESWTVRYLVGETGHWLPGRRVLISPIAIRNADWGNRRLNVNLTCEQVKESPDVETHRPLSRRWEARYHAYYQWPVYWAGAALWGVAAYPSLLAEQEPEPAVDEDASDEDSRLQSTRDVTGYQIHALDGDIGHVADLLMDEENWAIRYFVIDTGAWWPGKQVLLSPDWVDEVKWSEAKVYTPLMRERIQSSPAYDPRFPVTREYEADLFAHYGQTRYWDAEEAEPQG
jgi:hypothetical protein